MKCSVLFLFCTLLIAGTSKAQSFASFGILGDGTDEGGKIQTALNSGNGTPIVITMDGAKTYLSGKNLVIPDNVTLEGNGATLKSHSSLGDTSKLFLGTKNSTKFSASGLAIAVTAGSNTFTYGNASALTVGDIVLVSNSTPYLINGDDTYTHGFYGRVMGITGTTVTLEKPAVFSFTGTDIRQYATTTGIRIKNLNVDLRGQTKGYAIGGQSVYDMQIIGCKTVGDLKPANSLEQGFFVQGSNVLIERCRAIDGKYSDSGGTVAYGFNVNGHDITVQYCYAKNQRHGITNGGRRYNSVNVKYLYDTCIQGVGVAAPMDFHAMTWGVMKGNYLRANPPNTLCVEVRSDSTQVLDNDIEYDNSSNLVQTPIGIWLMEGASKNILIKNNKIKIIGGGRAIGNSSVQPLGALSDFRIDSNYFIGCGVTLKGAFGVGVRVWANRFDQLGTAYPALSFGAATFSNGYNVSYNKVVNTNGNTFNYFFSSHKDTTTNAKVQYNELWLTNSSNTSPMFRLDGAGITCNNNTVHSDASSLTIVADYDGTNITTPNTKIGLGTPPPASVPCTALKLDGVDDYIKMPTYNLSGNFTLESWVKLPNVGTNNDVVLGHETLGRALNFHNNTFRLYDASASPIDVIIASQPNPVNVWTHYAVTRSGNVMSIYINGQLDATKTTTWANTYVLQTIGRTKTTGYLDGALDEVRIWGVARTAAQIAANYDKSFTETTTGLLGYYKFNEAATEQTVWDASPNAWHGTLGASAVVETSDPVRTTTSYAPLSDGCQVTASTRRSAALTLVEETPSIGIHIFPNPAKETTTISVRAARSGVYQVHVTDMGGRTVYRKDVFINRGNATRLTIRLPQTTSGILLVHVQGNGDYKLEKILRTMY